MGWHATIKKDHQATEKRELCRTWRMLGTGGSGMQHRMRFQLRDAIYRIYRWTYFQGFNGKFRFILLITSTDIF